MFVGKREGERSVFQASVLSNPRCSTAIYAVIVQEVYFTSDFKIQLFRQTRAKLDKSVHLTSGTNH